MKLFGMVIETAAARQKSLRVHEKMGYLDGKRAAFMQLGFKDWIYEPPMGGQRIIVSRAEWEEVSQIICRKDIRSETNVAGLLWKPVKP